MFYEGAPWPIQRRRALELINIFAWPEYLRLQEVAREEDTCDCEEEDFATPPPLDEADLYRQWFGWRNGVVKKYSLKAFVAAVPQPTP